MTPISIYAKLAAGLAIVLAIVAFGWHEYKAGEVAGAATVQQKWDKQTAQVSQATTAAVTAAASDALANYKQAGVSVQTADQHKAQQAAVRNDLKQQVANYETKNRTSAASAGPSGNAGAGCSAGLDDDGLRIWNAANAAANGGGAVAASDSAASAAGRL